MIRKHFALLLSPGTIHKCSVTSVTATQMYYKKTVLSMQWRGGLTDCVVIVMSDGRDPAEGEGMPVADEEKERHVDIRKICDRSLTFARVNAIMVNNN
ncbi:MAG: hypothetical protein IJ751_07380 [Oscillospiraceae bacterium]|nr:hypothetical protein [Oscillospiraceae bacterium]